MSAAQRNRLRFRAVAIARAWKELLAERGGVARVMLTALGWLIRSPRRAYRRVFLTDGALRVAAHHVLADLRDFAFADKSAFDPDPLIMARREGRRDVWLRITRYLNLDEAHVQTLMEIDDGFGD